MRIVRMCTTYKSVSGIGTQHLLVFSMEVDCILMLQLYVSIVGLFSRLFSLFFIPLHESSISPLAMCEYFGTTLFCQSRQLQV